MVGAEEQGQWVTTVIFVCRRVRSVGAEEYGQWVQRSTVSGVGQGDHSHVTVCAEEHGPEHGQWRLFLSLFLFFFLRFG